LQAGADMVAGKVLVVDDLPDWRTTLAGLVADQGYYVQVASSVEEALRVLNSETFHVAVLDVRLDDSDEDNREGLILMGEIKERWPSIQVIILTGYAEVRMVQDALNPDKDGVRLAHSFLEKTQTDLLVERVRQAYEGTVHYLIAQGEQENIEFKSSIRWDYKNKNVNKEFQKVISRTIAGMMNNNGGMLLIGIADDGTVLGIEKDLQTLRKPNRDEFELVLIEIVQNNLGLEFIKHINIRFEPIDEKDICLVSIEPSVKPVFLISGNDSEFWVRIRNSTRRLNVKDATEHIQTHWKK